MKYSLINFSCGVETMLDENNYTCPIKIEIHPEDGIADNFLKSIDVISQNSMTGTEVDEQRLQAVNDFMDLINL